MPPPDRFVRLVRLPVVLVAVCGALATLPQPDFSGTWRLDAGASRITTEKGLAGLGAAAPEELHVTHAANGALILSSLVNGAQARAYQIDGDRDVPAPGGEDRTMRMATRRDGERLISEGTAELEGAEIGVREAMSLSADGRTLTLEVTTTTAAGAETNILVYRKAGPSF